MSDRCGRLTTLLLFSGASGLVLAEDIQEPEMEFLEYLGQWEESDEEWVMIDRQLSIESGEQTDSEPRGEESAEKDDES